MLNNKSKVIVILGPTSSGKSDIAIRLAKKLNGEIVSADSRQIYREMNIGTGKMTGVLSKANDLKFRPFISKNILHYGIDIVSPKIKYNAAKFKKYADKIIANILKRGKLPIICGGTGFWIKAIVDNVVYPEVKPDWVLRNKLNNKDTKELFAILKKFDPERAKNIDKKNPVRLIRAIEICKSLGKVPSSQPSLGGKKGNSSSPSGRECPEETGKGSNFNYEFLQIGIKLSKKKLRANIKKRLQKRFKAGMIEEVKKLKKSGLSWKKIQSFGLGYKLIPEYLREEVYPVKSGEAGAKLFNRELFEKIYQAEKDYAKRQMTWFKKNKRIIWLEKYRDIEKEIEKFLF